MLEKDLEEIAELEAANAELEAYRAELGAVPAAPPSDASLALEAENNDAQGSPDGLFRAQDAALAARKSALRTANTRLRIEVDARESGSYAAIPVAAQRVVPARSGLPVRAAVLTGLGVVVLTALFAFCRA